MDNLQLLLASLILLVICLVIYFNNIANSNKQTMLLKVAVVIAFVASGYLYSRLTTEDLNTIWPVSGGEVNDTGSDFIVNMMLPS